MAVGVDSDAVVIKRYLRAIQARDMSCMNDLYNLFSKTARFIAFKYLQNNEETDDLVQEFWRDIYEIADSYYGANALAYLKKVVKNRALNKLKVLNRKLEHETELYEAYLLCSDRCLSVEQLELKNDVERALNSLPSDERAVIDMVVYERATVREIASYLKISTPKAERLRQAAMETLRDYFTKEKEKQGETLKNGEYKKEKINSAIAVAADISDNNGLHHDFK